MSCGRRLRRSSLGVLRLHRFQLGRPSSRASALSGRSDTEAPGGTEHLGVSEHRTTAGADAAVAPPHSGSPDVWRLTGGPSPLPSPPRVVEQCRWSEVCDHVIYDVV